MSRHLSITRFLSVVLLLDVALIALVAFTGAKSAAILSGVLPGKFGPGMGPLMTGNHLLGALIVNLDALLFLAAGFAVLLNASRRALMIGAGGIARLLAGTAGLSREDIAATSFAVAEEQKSEIHVVHTGRNLVWIGAVLLLLAFPAVCFTWAKADSAGAPLLRDAGGAVANAAVTVEDVAVFAADQLADAVLLDVPRVYKWHATSLTPGENHRWLKPFVLLYHILDKLIVLATLFAAWRSGHLRAYLLGMGGLDAVAAVSLRDAPQPAPSAPTAANDHQPAPREEPLPPQPRPQQPLWEHTHEHDAPPALEASILEVPIYVEPAPEPEPEKTEATPAPEPAEPTPPQDEEPLSLEASILEVPVYVQPAHPEPAPEPQPPADAPLALHELKTPPADDAPADAGALADDDVHPMPYKNTALHMDAEIDA